MNEIRLKDIPITMLDILWIIGFYALLGIFKVFKFIGNIPIYKSRGTKK